MGKEIASSYSKSQIHAKKSTLFNGKLKDILLNSMQSDHQKPCLCNGYVCMLCGCTHVFDNMSTKTNKERYPSRWLSWVFGWAGGKEGRDEEKKDWWKSGKVKTGPKKYI